MSRNLGTTDCCSCPRWEPPPTTVRLVGPVHPITRAEAGSYFDEYEGMLVADAECSECGAKYLAWVDERPRRRPHGFDREPCGAFCDLSYRSSFNDEPGEDDVPRDRSWPPSRLAALEAENARLKALADAARAWFEAQRGTMATMGPTGLAVEAALKALEVVR